MNFLQGILADLREKRLLPVAAALAIALVALPLLLHKSAGAEPQIAAPAATAAGAPGAGPDQPLVTLATLRTDSDLDTFDSRNPFRSLRQVPELTSPDQLTAPPSSGGSSSGASSGGGSSVGSGGTDGDTGAGLVSPGVPFTPSTDPVTPPSDGDDVPPEGGDETTVTKALFTHEVDIAFGRRGKFRNMRGIRRLSLLPSANEPLLVFLGVDPGATTAMFLVDADFDQSGEGVCRPSRADCRFLSLKVDDDQDEHLLLDATGNEFYFRLRDIDRVAIDPEAATASLTSFPPLLDVAEIAVAETSPSAAADGER